MFLSQSLKLALDEVYVKWTDHMTAFLSVSKKYSLKWKTLHCTHNHVIHVVINIFAQTEHTVMATLCLIRITQRVGSHLQTVIQEITPNGPNENVRCSSSRLTEKSRQKNVWFNQCPTTNCRYPPKQAEFVFILGDWSMYSVLYCHECMPNGAY